jgi:hypothetical protein
MDGYETYEILSQALDLAEDVENDTIFITQSTFQNNEGILHVLKKARNRANPKIYVKKLNTKIIVLIFQPRMFNKEPGM